MTADHSWYQVVESGSLNQVAPLEQGDILSGCPRFAVTGIPAWPPPEDSEVEVEMESLTAIVLTQTCDLVQDHVEMVLMCAVVDWPAARQQMVKAGNEKAKSRAFREALVRGNLPALALLHKHEHEHAPSLDWSVVDFHQIFALPKKLVIDVAAAAGPRLRLRSPYKEHLAQAFARYFMRVGLPLDARDFVKEGKE